MKLTQEQVDAALNNPFEKRKSISDGAGLVLRVRGARSRCWIVHYGSKGSLSIGSAHDVPLEEARAKAAEVRETYARGNDPVQLRRFTGERKQFYKRFYGHLSQPKVDKIIAARQQFSTTDGGGLALKVSPSGIASWVFYSQAKDTYGCVGLGPAHKVTLQEARCLAKECRRFLAAGVGLTELRRFANRPPSRAKRCEIKGVTYESAAVAAKTLGIKERTLQQAIRRQASKYKARYL